MRLHPFWTLKVQEKATVYLSNLWRLYWMCEEKYMKKRMICMCMAIAMLCTACQNTGRNETRDMREEIAETLKIASYDNLEILFDEMKYYDGQDLVIMEVQKYEVGEGSTYEETLEMTVEEIIPSLLEVEAVDRNKIYDLYSKVSDEENGAYYAKNYDAILASLDNYETIPELLYFDPETHTKFYYSSNWKSGVYISQGVLGTYADSDSPFGASGIIEDVKTYECRFDDLSDSYALLDGEKTVAEAKEEMESYLNAHYPIVELDNGFGNEVYEITAGKIAGTDHPNKYNEYS